MTPPLCDVRLHHKATSQAETHTSEAKSSQDRDTAPARQMHKTAMCSLPPAQKARQALSFCFPSYFRHSDNFFFFFFKFNVGAMTTAL